MKNHFENHKNPTRLFTEKEVSVLTGISQMTLRSHRHLRRGLPYVKIGALVRYPAEAVEQYLDDRSIRPDSA